MMEADRIAIDKEANSLVVDVSCTATYCGNPMRVFIPLEEVQTFLTTRRQLETAKSAIEAIIECTSGFGKDLDWHQTTLQVCREALDAIKKEGE